MRHTAIAAVVLLTSLGCTEGSKPSPLKRTAAPAGAVLTAQAPNSLYQRLGGHPGIAKVVDDFVANVVADDKIKGAHRKHFGEGNVEMLKRKLIDQLGQATGGPEKYTGKNMKDAHQGLKITDADFDALVVDLTQALDQNKVPAADKDELLGMLAPMRADIVEKP